MNLNNILERVIRAVGGMLDSNDFHYIGGTEVLPEPLSPEAEAEALSRLEDPNGDSRRLLIEHNLRLVVYIAKKFDNTGSCMDDLISIGSIGLIKAINTYKVDKNIKIATYASKCIENEILMYLRRSQRSKNDISLDEPLNVDSEGNELLLSDIIGTEDDTLARDMEEECDRKVLRDAVSELSLRERQIVEMRFGLGGCKELTQKEVADALGISQSYISRLEKRIFTRLRKELQQRA
ncbi:MAG: RNA polymerase sporulation sigma factor SigE [Clostridia bacterium]|nr:RNA polymerase sporulation sigma factor SigE [Clostridia bacterium]